MAKKKRGLDKAKKDLWKVFTKYIKLKHSPDGVTCSCYTCGKTLIIGTKDCQGGHYYKKVGYPSLYFDENNVRPQCIYCNKRAEGKKQEFRHNLREEVGLMELERMWEIRLDKPVMTVQMYDELSVLYIAKIKELQDD